MKLRPVAFYVQVPLESTPQPQYEEDEVRFTIPSTSPRYIFPDSHNNKSHICHNLIGLSNNPCSWRTWKDSLLRGWVGKKWYVRCPRRMNEIEAAKQTRSNSQSLWDQVRDSIPGQHRNEKESSTRSLKSTSDQVLSVFSSFTRPSCRVPLFKGLRVQCTEDGFLCPSWVIQFDESDCCFLASFSSSLKIYERTFIFQHPPLFHKGRRTSAP